MKKIAVFANEAILQANNGYYFAYGFYKFLSKYYDVVILIPKRFPYLEEKITKINQNLTIRIVTADEDWLKKNPEVINYYDMATVAHKDGDLVSKIKLIVGDIDTIICDTFLWAKLVMEVFPQKKLIVRSLDVEQDKIDQAYASKQLLNDEEQECRDKFRKQMVELEEFAYKRADLCWALTAEDGRRLSELYKVSSQKFYVLPLCIENLELYKGFQPVSHKNMPGTLDVVFVGYLVNDAWNIFDAIVDTASKMPMVNFHIIGRQIGRQIGRHNLFIYGELSEEKKREIILVCDCALNLSMQTYGMNTKVLDYILLGCPVMSTELGVRGYSLEKYVSYFPCEINNLPAALKGFMDLTESERQAIAQRAYALLFERHDYGKYIYKVIEHIGKDEDDESIVGETSYIIFGCGDAGRRALQHLKNNNEVCDAFTDNNHGLIGCKHLGYDVISPKEAIEKLRHNEYIKIIIATNTPSYLRAMYSQVHDNCIHNKKICLYCFDEMHDTDIDVSKIAERNEMS